MLNWIGIDIHKRTCEFCVLNNKGAVLKRQHVRTEEKSLIAALSNIKGERYVVIEESTISHWIYCTLKPYANKFVISNPKKNRLIHGDEEKDDGLDCLKLADLYRMNKIYEVYHSEVEELITLRKLVNHYYKVDSTGTRTMNRIKAEYSYYGIFAYGTKVYHSQREEYLAQVPSGSRFILENYFSELDACRLLKAKVIKELKKMVKGNATMKWLQSVPGFGFIRSITYFSAILTPDRFPDKSKLHRYCGLAVISKGSGGVVYCTKASREGNRYLKHVLIDAAITCISRSKRNEFRKEYDGLLERCLTPKTARRTVARSINAKLFGLWKKGETYNAEKHNRKATAEG